MSAKQTSRWLKLTSSVSSSRSEIPATPQGSVARRSISMPRMLCWMVTVVILVGASVYVRAEIHRRIAYLEKPPTMGLTPAGGTLLIAGGGHLSEMIRHRFIELAGGTNSRIVVIPAEVIDDEARESYRQMWLKYEVKSVDVLHTTSRATANDVSFCEVLSTATGVWLGGGQQTWLADWYGGTLVESRLKEVLSRNGVIGGTSAGAAIMSGIMIAGGRGTPVMGRGFDLIPGAVIDQHFIKRNRIGRLYQVLERHPDLIGFGIDEETALQYAIKTGSFQVLGQSCVVACVLDAGNEKSGKFRLQFMNPGDEFDIERLRRGDQIQPAFSPFEEVLFGE
ncbi:cyanophycinase [Schlesneria sp. T3-172]|uniref:cyanophycinase n=1 Tax=Schlesneria sphaerica TaxID=3373610 RepID=UPI0037C8C9CC